MSVRQWRAEELLVTTVHTDDLANISDAELRDRAETAIMAASIMAATPEYHAACSAVYDECAKRGRGIYQRVWNSVARSQDCHSWAREPSTGDA